MIDTHTQYIIYDRHKNKHTHIHTHTHTPAAHFISLFFFQKRNKTKNDAPNKTKREETKEKIQNQMAKPE